MNQDAEDDKPKKKVYKKLKNKYRLVILNDDTFEEKISFRLTPLNVFTYVGLLVIILITAVTTIIAFTPLREYIPGYSDIKTKRNAAYAVLKADSLQQELNMREGYISNLRVILSGDVPVDSVSQAQDTNINVESIEDTRTPADSSLRQNVEKAEKYTINSALSPNNTSGAYLFFTPVKGTVTSSFNADEEHFGVDVATKDNESIKAVLDGTVFFSGWTTDDGYIVQIQHRNNLVSVYKHCSVLLKKSGESVKAGDAIAIVGNTGENTTGPHLHFELWENGSALNPELYINF